MPFVFSRLTNHFKTDSLFRNSIYLMASTGFVAILGFVFWLIAARLYSPHDIGIGTTLISIGTLIGALAQLGFNNSLVRYLPLSKNPSRLVSSAATLSGILSVILAIGYLLLATKLTPSLSFIRSSPYLYFFIFFAFWIGLNNIFENLFIALRVGEFVLFKNAVLSISKLVFAVILARFGGFGVFASFGIGMSLGVLASSVTSLRRHGLRLKPTISRSEVEPLIRFSAANYLITSLSMAPGLILPAIIINRLGASAAAYYYIAYSIVGLLYAIPLATSNSFFAEGSQVNANAAKATRDGIKIIGALLVPSAVLLIIVAPYFLSIFGAQYATHGTTVLRLLALSSIPIAVSYMASALLNLQHKLKQLVVMNLMGVSLILVSCWWYAPLGITAVATAWVSAQSIIAVLYLMVLKVTLTNLRVQKA